MIWLVAIVFLFIAYVFYNQWTWTHAFWEFKCVPGPNPLPFIGNILQYLLGTKSMGELCLGWSKQHKDSPLVGFYNFLTPFVIINRSDYVEIVLKNNFFSFSDRLRPRSNKNEGSNRLLHLSTGATWRLLRTKIAPLFTVEKIKEMTPQIKMCSEKVLNHINENISRDLSANEIIRSYMVGVTAKLVYGIDLEGSSSLLKQFSVQCDKMFEDSMFKTLNKLIYANIPKLADYLQIPAVPAEQVLYFKRILEQSFRERKASGSKRNDIVQILLDLKEKGVVDVETINDPENEHLVPPQNIGHRETVEVTEELLASQALIFLTTGFETVCGAITFTLLELCQNPNAADHLIKEIDTVLQRHNDLTYEALKEMKYLDMCIMESLRLHPAMELLNRCCTRNYTFDNGLQIPKMIMATIPVLAIHNDPQNYIEPEKYKPERFTVPPLPGTYLGFGDGFRSCIAKNLAMIEMKMMLAQLWHRYEVKLSRRTVLPPVMSKRSFISKPITPIYFSITKRLKA